MKFPVEFLQTFLGVPWTHKPSNTTKTENKTKTLNVTEDQRVQFISLNVAIYTLAHPASFFGDAGVAGIWVFP